MNCSNHAFSVGWLMVSLSGQNSTSCPAFNNTQNQTTSDSNNNIGFNSENQNKSESILEEATKKRLTFSQLMPSFPRTVPMTPIIAFERLFFAVFGQTSPDDINSQRSTRPEWTENLFKIVFGIYMLVSVVVLINLLIAMMSDTYQRIQVRPKFGKVPKSRFLFLSFFSFPLVTTTCVCVRAWACY